MIARCREAGLTLVEMMIALFIVAIVTTGGSMLLTQTLRGTKAVATRAEELEGLQTALSRLRDDLRAITPRTTADPAGAMLPSVFEGYNYGPDGRIALFTRNGWSNPGSLMPRGDLQRVEYRFDDGTLWRRSWSYPDAAPATRFVEEPLISGLARVSADFGRGDVWRPEWIVRAQSGEPAPSKMRLTLTFGDADALTAEFWLGLPQ